MAWAAHDPALTRLVHSHQPSMYVLMDSIWPRITTLRASQGPGNP